MGKFKMTNILNLLKLTNNIKKKGVWLSGTPYHGEYKEWWTDGTIFEHSFWKEGCRHGICKKWSGWGTLEIYVLYKNGEIIERYKEYNIERD